MSDTYGELWNGMSWKERGQFLVNHGNRELVKSEDYVALSRLWWNELPTVARESISFEFFIIGTVEMVKNQ